jgi:hypothetical protein
MVSPLPTPPGTRRSTAIRPPRQLHSPPIRAGDVDFAAANATNEIGVFRGIGPRDVFDCLAPSDLPSSKATQNPNGSWTLPPSTPRHKTARP